MEFQIIPKDSAPDPPGHFWGPQKTQNTYFSALRRRPFFSPLHKGRRASRAALRAAQENWNPAKCLEKGLKTIISRGKTVRNAQKVLKTPPQSRILLQVTLGAAPNVAEMREKGLQNRPFGAERATNTPKVGKNDLLRPVLLAFGTIQTESG